MDFGELFRIWRRQAALTGGLILLALLVSLAALAWLPGTYQAQGSVVLLASRAESKPTGGNPYLNFSPSLSLTADVLSRTLAAPATAARLARLGFSDPYTVAPPAYATTTTGSVLVITVTGGKAAGVERTLHGVITQLTRSLAQLQGQVRPRGRITVATLSSSPAATLAASATMRPIAATFAAGLLAALGIPVVADGMLRRRAIRRAPLGPEGGGRHAGAADGWRSIGVS